MKDLIKLKRSARERYAERIIKGFEQLDQSIHKWSDSKIDVSAEGLLNAQRSVQSNLMKVFIKILKMASITPMTLVPRNQCGTAQKNFAAPADLG